MPEGVHFRVWAPLADQLDVVLEVGEGENKFPLENEGQGYFSGLIPQAKEGSLYRYRINGEDFLYPDPASRYQPQGPYSPSQIVNPSLYTWHDQQWKGIAAHERILYEMHVGTFTQDGTWQSAKDQLSNLKELGITVIEMMPVNEFPGKFGWGYDGVNLFAPSHLYGDCDFRILRQAPFRPSIGLLQSFAPN